MDKTIIEVNGVKLEVDLRTATRIDTLRVGDRVKVLTKEPYGSSHKVFPGVVVGFEPFEALPTIIVAYMDLTYNEVTLKFVYLNTETKDTEVIKAIDNDQLDVDRVALCSMFDRQIAVKQREAEDLEKKKAFFLEQFRKYWEFESVTMKAD
jgi:hypothetical protein